jgi:uncharacterized protein YrrD
MSKRASDVIGRPVVSADTGKRLGVVGDLLLDDGGRHLLGVVVTHGAFRGEDVLPVESVQSLGNDAVVSRSETLITAREWRTRDRVTDVPGAPGREPNR